MSSLRRSDLLALSNLRNDGRKPHEIRRMRVQMSCASKNDTSGSAIVQMGLTSVMATVSGPMDCTRKSDELSDRAILEVSMRVAPFAASSGDRRYINPNTDRRLQEQGNLIQRAMEASILMHLHPRSKIELNIVVLADDGGRLCVAINAATLALVDAGVPIRDFVCACSAGLVDDTTLVDLNRQELSNNSSNSNAVYLPCATMPQRNTVVLTQCESRLASTETLKRVLEAAMAGCQAVFQVMSNAVRERAMSLHTANHGTAKVRLNFQD